MLVLPQGGQGGNYGAVGDLDPREYALAALKQLGDPPPLLGAVLLSGHSGGGFAIKTILDDQVRRRTLSGVVWFDAVQGTARGGASTGQVERAKALIAERIAGELGLLDDKVTDAAAVLRFGFRFRLYYQRSGYYDGAASEVQSYLQALFGEAGAAPAGADGELARKIAALSEPARKALRERYQVLPVELGTDRSKGPATTGHDNMVGSGALEQAIKAMPYGTAVEGGTLARMPARRSAPRTLARQAVPPADVAAQLVDATVALGHADGDPPTGRTLLRRDDIRTALTGRAANAALNGAFDASVRQIGGLAGDARAQSLAANASGLILMLEDAFIQDAARSGLDLLPTARAAHFRGMRWDRLDYPGHATDEAAGPNEGEATAMSSEMAALRPERRPNQGAANVVTSDEMTAARWGRINANLQAVEGQGGRRLFAEAARQFHRMSELARYDNVELRILDAFRPRATAAANAAAAGNAMAVAAFSSHSLGLAVDLAMSVEGGAQFAEMTTRPMSNVAGMRSSPAYKWMLLRGAQFGWFPYGHEPWHWEYNPEGFRERFRALVMEAPAPAAAAAPTGPAAVARSPRAVQRTATERRAPRRLVARTPGPPSYLVSHTFCGVGIAGINPEMAKRLDKVEAHLKTAVWAKMPADAKFSRKDGSPTTDMNKWLGIESIGGWKQGSFHSSGSAIDVDASWGPYIATRNFDAKGNPQYGGEAAGAGLVDERRRALEVNDRAMQWLGHARADLSHRGANEKVGDAYDRLELASIALSIWMMYAIRTVEGGGATNMIRRAPIKDAHDPTKVTNDQLLQKIPETERLPKDIGVELIREDMARDWLKQVHPSGYTMTPEQMYFQILRDYETVRIPMVSGAPEALPGITRNPVSGFIHHRKALVEALVEVGGMRWGACDFAAGVDGDTHHFDLGTHAGYEPSTKT